MHLAIIGAGMAGLAAARALHTQLPELAITVYEKSRGFGGRVATRRKDGYVFDHGAQCIKGPTPAVERLLTQELANGMLRRIELPTWTFNGAGTISEGDARMNAERNYTYADGNNRLGKLLAEGLDVRREVRVGSLRRRMTDDGQQTKYDLVDVNGHAIGEADIVLLTAPGPQSAEIISASDVDEQARQALLDELNKSTYRRCLSVALAYDRVITRPFYALVNTDRAHPLAWLALEHTKAPERCPPNHSLIMAQMAPQWSVEHYDMPLEAYLPEVTASVGTLLGEDVNTPLWADLQRWRYALPDKAADFERLNQLGAEHGVFFAGDFVDTKGRVHLAIERGWQVAELIGNRISRA